MISGVSPNAATATGSNNGTSTAPTTATGSSQVTKNMFLQLLVSQIKNQDPLNPTDGVQFLTQLAQFQQMEQSLNMGQDIAGIRSDLDLLAGTGTTTGTTANTI